MLKRTPYTPWIDINGEHWPIILRPRKGMKRITLRRAPGKRAFIVSFSPRLARRHVREFITKHEAWMRRAGAAVPPDALVEPGAEFPFRGERYLLEESKTRPDYPHRIGCVETDTDRLVVWTGPAGFAPTLMAALKAEARTHYAAQVRKDCGVLGLNMPRIHIGDAKSRWGHCRRGKRGIQLGFSWRAIMAPPFVLRYLSAHECAHILHMNHGPAFWDCVGSLDPDYQRAETWLKCEGSTLMHYSFARS
ncbi:MAG: YgjP-like metallopeptidase domain-containing protein [Pseudomonadota bacterium]